MIKRFPVSFQHARCGPSNASLGLLRAARVSRTAMAPCVLSSTLPLCAAAQRTGTPSGGSSSLHTSAPSFGAAAVSSSTCAAASFSLERGSAVWCAKRHYASAPGSRPPSSSSSSPNTASMGEEDAGVEFVFDPMASVRHDAAVESAKQNVDAVLESLLPPNAPPAAITKVRQYLEQHPVDRLIVAASVQLTHVENPETGLEERMSLSPCTTEEALEQAQLRGMNLVQMGANGEVAFCRIRHEKPWVAKLIEVEMKEVVTTTGDTADGEDAGEAAARGDADGGEHTHPQQRGRAKQQVDHQFRDVVDAHFIGWRSKKICQDLQRGHPVKITIRDFQSPEAAIHKLREMCNAMRTYAEEKGISHHYTSIIANDREASIAFSPSAGGKSGNAPKQVKHPGEKEWAQSLRRMEEACKKVGRSGTYVKSGVLKPRNVGATMYRTDKYGRRMS